jgi:N-acyl-D-amino-acid deacylase
VVRVRFDLLLSNARIVNGAGNPWFKADIGVTNGRIAQIGRLAAADAAHVIDVEGLFIAPGFIDAHSHTDLVLPFYSGVESTLRQGVTTLITGNCGISLAPVAPATKDLLVKSVSPHLPRGARLEVSWSTFDEYLRYEATLGLAANIGHLVGHGTVRTAVIGFEDRAPSVAELARMKRLVAEALEAGALGLSTGLIYPPGLYAGTAELIELARVVARYGGIYASHIRGEGKTLMEAVKEAIAVGEAGGLPVEISHHKASGRPYWGQTVASLELIAAARRRGVDVTCDQYPYLAGMTSLATLLPPWAHEGGLDQLVERLRSSEERRRIRQDMEAGLPGWENILATNGWDNIRVSSVRTDENRGLEGHTLAEIADIRMQPDAYTALFDLLVEEDGAATMLLFSMSEEDVRRVMTHPAHMVGSDSWSVAPSGIMSGGKPHPRFYGTYPRILGTYVREDGVLTLEDAIRRMTSFPARRFRLRDRGLILKGMWADLVVFNAETIRDRASYADPHRYPDGIEYVVVNGQLVIERGRNTGIRAGKVLRRT